MNSRLQMYIIVHNVHNYPYFVFSSCLSTFTILTFSELLKFPKLSNEFFKLITFICEVYPEKVVGLPESVVDQIVLMLKVGLNKLALL